MPNSAAAHAETSEKEKEAVAVRRGVTVRVVFSFFFLPPSAAPPLVYKKTTAAMSASRPHHYSLKLVGCRDAFPVVAATGASRRPQREERREKKGKTKME